MPEKPDTLGELTCAFCANNQQADPERGIYLVGGNKPNVAMLLPCESCVNFMDKRPETEKILIGEMVGLAKAFGLVGILMDYALAHHFDRIRIMTDAERVDMRARVLFAAAYAAGRPYPPAAAVLEEANKVRGEMTEQQVLDRITKMGFTLQKGPKQTLH